MGAALGVAEDYDTLRALADRRHRALAEGPVAASRAAADQWVAPALAGIGHQHGTDDDQAGQDEGDDADDQQPSGHGAEGQERDRLEERADPENQHPADSDADRRRGQREEQVATGPAVPALPARRLDQQVPISGHTSPASSMPPRDSLTETTVIRPSIPHFRTRWPAGAL